MPPAKRPKPSERERFCVEALEPRLLYSADLGPSLLASALVSPVAEHRLLEAEAPPADSAVAAEQTTQTREIVFVDAETPDAERLIADIRSQSSRPIDVVQIGADEDGLARISAELAARQGISAVHIISHGSDGAVQLGSSVLDLDAVEARSALLSGWSFALTDEADVLIYGCDVAQTDAGRELLQRLSALTGADVAASTDLTGSAALGGDWDLEYRTGAIEAQLALSQAAQDEWFAVLNAAPVLGGANDLTAINEDPASNPGTLVSALIAGQVSDSDPGDVIGIAVTGVDNTNGTWEYSTDGGGSWNAFGSPSIAAARLLAPDANTYVRFVPNADFNGTVTNGLTFYAWDQTSGTAGGTAELRTTVRDNFGVVSYSNNDGTGTWTGDWVESDGGGASGGSIKVSGGVLELQANNASDLIYREANLAGATSATLSFDYLNDLNSGTGGLVQLQVSSDGGTSYTTIANFSETANTGTGTFSADISAYIASNTRIQFLVAGKSTPTKVLQVDNLQIAYDVLVVGGSSAFSSTSASSDITVVPVNDAPVLTPAGPALTSLTEDQVANAGQTVASIVGASISDVDAGALQGIAITGLASGNGSWEYSIDGGSTWTAVGAVSDTSSLLLRSTDWLRFVPDGQNATTASIDYRAWDRTSGTPGTKLDTSVNGGTTAFSSATDTASVTVSAVNDAPVLAGANDLGGISEDAFANAGTLVSALIAGQASDVDTGALSGIAVTGVDNTNGAWEYSTDGGGSWSAFGSPSSAAARLLAADANSYVRFVPNANFNGTVSNGLTFRAWDRTSGAAGSSADTTSNGGTTAFSSATASASIAVNPVNDAPVGTSNTVTTLEDTAHVFTAAQFGFSDPSDSPANSLLAVQITTLPGAGTLTNNGTAVTAGQFVSAADIGAGLLVFAPAANASGAGYASFTFKVQDDGGGADLDVTARTMTIDVTPVNDAPVGTSNTVTMFEDTTHVFGAAEFGFSDPSDSPANSLLAVQITALPGAGTLTNNGTAVTAGQFVSAVDIGAGRLVFAPAADANGAGYASFTFRMQDDGGVANGGVDLDVTARTMTIDVTPVNDAPVGVPTITGMATEDQTLIADTAGISDVDGLGAFNYQWLRNGAAIAGANASAYVLGDADAGTQISVQVGYTDAQGTIEGPLSSAQTAAVANVNDAPIGTGNAFAMLQDGFHVFSTVEFGFTDPSDNPSNALLAVRITTVPALGALTNNAATVTAGQFVSAADIAAGRLLYAPEPGAFGSGYASFTFQVQDDGGTAIGGVNLDPTARTMTINVNAGSVPVVPPVVPPIPPDPPPPIPPPAIDPPPPDTGVEPGPGPTAARPRPGAEGLLLGGVIDDSLRPPAGVDTTQVLNPAVAQSHRTAAAGPAAPANLLAAVAPTPLAAEVDKIDLNLFGLISASNPAAGGGSSAGQGETSLVEELDRIRDEITDQGQLEQWVAGSAAVGGFGLTVGYVLWLLRGGALLASLLSSLPAWRLIDPLPVLARADEDENEDEGDDDDAFESFLEGGPAAPLAEERA